MVVDDLGDAIKTGLKGRCPNCGQASIFDGYLKFARACPACNMSFEDEDVADGPAVFVIFIASFFIVPLALAHMLITDASAVFIVLLWTPILIAFCMALLRPFRGLMYALQVRHKAVEIVSDEVDLTDQ